MLLSCSRLFLSDPIQRGVSGESCWVFTDLLPLPGAQQQQSLWNPLCPFDQKLWFFVPHGTFTLDEVLDLESDQSAWSGIAVQTWGSRGCGTMWRCRPPGPTSMAGWWMWRYSVVLVSDVTPFLLLIAWQLWFSDAPEPVGTWGGRFSQWRDFLLQFSSATIIDCGARELHPLFYVQLGFGVQKAFHVLILCPYLINFKNTLFFVFLSISASHGQLLMATVGNKCKKLLNDMLNLKA